MKELVFTLGKLIDSDIDWMLATGQKQKISTGTILIEEGKPIDRFYIVLEGKLLVSVAGLEGEAEIGSLSCGDVVGEIPLIDAHPPTTTVKALEPSLVLLITQQKLAAKQKQDGGFAARFNQAIAVVLSNRLRSISALLARTKIVPGQPLRKILFVFGELSDGDIDWMIVTGRREKNPVGTVLIRQGEPAEALYILLEGTLSVFVAIESDGQKIDKEIAKLASGEIVGEMSFIDALPPSATVKANETCVVLALPQIILAAKMQQDAGFAARFYRAIAVLLADRLRDRLVRRGFGRLAYNKNQPLQEDVEYEDELDLNVLDNVSLAGVRFEWMLNRLRVN